MKRKADGVPVGDISVVDKVHPVIELLEKLNARVVITDFSPRREDVQLVNSAADLIPKDVTLFQVYTIYKFYK